MTKKRVTLKEVAAAANVDPSTVSRALNPKTRALYREELIARVEKASRELGYHPNPNARGLRTNRSMMVGVLIPDITNPIFPPIVRGIEDALEASGYAAILSNTDDSHKDRENRVDWLRSHGVDGLIVGSAHLNDDIIERAGNAGLAMVMVNRRADHPGISSVISDDRSGIEEAVNHVRGLGHKRVAFISGPRYLSTGRDRFEAFKNAANKYELVDTDKLWVEAKFYNEDEGIACARQLVDRDTNFTAIVAANDRLAIGAVDALKEIGLHCPRDISVTGFNDMPFADRLQPSLTTVKIQSYEAGYRASEILLSEIASSAGNHKVRHEVLPVELIVRESTGPVNASWTESI
ncbi:MAG: LacI family DNA-binding transcriptional regulator, partial [Desulfobulbia bacterium]